MENNKDLILLSEESISIFNQSLISDSDSFVCSKLLSGFVKKGEDGSNLSLNLMHRDIISGEFYYYTLDSYISVDELGNRIFNIEYKPKVLNLGYYDYFSKKNPRLAFNGLMNNMNIGDAKVFIPLDVIATDPLKNVNNLDLRSSITYSLNLDTNSDNLSYDYKALAVAKDKDNVVSLLVKNVINDSKSYLSLTSIGRELPLLDEANLTSGYWGKYSYNVRTVSSNNEIDKLFSTSDRLFKQLCIDLLCLSDGIKNYLVSINGINNSKDNKLVLNNN